MNETETELHERLMREANAANVSVLDFARAWSSIDGKRADFEVGEANQQDIQAGGGHFAGYMAEAEELLRRAASYARLRLNAKQG